jgi:hypothetical protein
VVVVVVVVLCRQKEKNFVFEARINKVWRSSKMWLGFNGAYLSIYHSVLDEF